MGDVNFSDLLTQAKQLTADVETNVELPKIERNIPQLAEASQRLLQKAKSTFSDNSDIKASLLLGSKGVEVPKISENLELLDSTKTFEPLEPTIDGDIATFLKNERENAILSIIEENKQKTFEHIERSFWENLENEWEKEKEKILNSLLGSGKKSLNFTFDSSTLEDNNIIKGRTSLSPIELAYARQLFVFNESNLRNESRSLFDLMKQAAAKTGDNNVKELWNLLEYLLTNYPMEHSKNTKKLRNSKEFQTHIVERSCNYLENAYQTFIETFVYSNLQQAQLGSLPGLFNLIQSFIKIKFQQNRHAFEDINDSGVPLWPLIYYCLRCGSTDALEEALNALPPLYADFRAILREYIRSEPKRLVPSNRAKLCLQYKRTVHCSTDPYKRAVFCIIAQCDNSDVHPEVISKTEDYIWLKLQQLHVEDDEPLRDDLSNLVSLQKLLLEDYGEGHFKAYEQPYLYCQVLFLTGQFEAGIEFLSRIDYSRCHAVHFAIAMDYLGVLMKPDTIHTPLLTSEGGGNSMLKCLNFARLITIYTQKFEITDPREAVEYFYLLRHMKESSGGNLFASCVSQLALESREFEILLGSVTSNGTKKPGCVSKYNLDVNKINATVAKDAENKGQYEDAVMLYDLCDNHDKVLELLSRLLGQYLPLQNDPQSSRERLQTIAQSIAERYKTSGHNGSRHQSATFFLLLDLMYFFDLYHENQHEEALRVIEKLKVVPLNIDEIDAKVTGFKLFSDEIKQGVSEVLVTTMNMLYMKYKKAKVSMQKKSLYGNNQKDEMILQNIRERSRALVTFAGLLPYRMPGDTNARLVQLEVLMN